MKNTNETIILKAKYYYSSFEARMCIEFEEIDNVNELDTMHVYKRVSKRCESIARDTKDYDIEICDSLTTIIISDFDMRSCDVKYKEDFEDDLNCACFNVEYDTIDYTLVQLA